MIDCYKLFDESSSSFKKKKDTDGNALVLVQWKLDWVIYGSHFPILSFFLFLYMPSLKGI